MNIEEFLVTRKPYSGRQDEFDLWESRSFKQQMQDVYGEASRLVKYHCEDDGKLASQWDVLDEFCAMTYASSGITSGEKEALKLAEWELYDYVFGENTFHNDEKSVMRWFNQWVFDVNYDALTEG